MAITMVVLDYNGLLVNDLPIHLECFEEIARKYNPKITSRKLQEIMHVPTIKKVELILGESASKDMIDKVLEEKEDLYMAKIKSRDIFFPGAIDVITKLSKRFKLAIISNTTKRQLDAALPKSVSGRFSYIMTYEEIPKPKPAPDSLFKVMETLHKKAEECCYVGDTPSDMEAAKNAGIIGIGIPSGNDSRKSLLRAGAYIVLKNIKELPAALDKIS